mmetsp:Transcript_15069/g.32917  ORF Transcript_15069/g.32917 Transcript_15069/m.32917 type:complete len:482 (+) Transcript_15069:172-1617(+)
MIGSSVACRALVLISSLAVLPSQTVFVRATETSETITSGTDILERSSRVGALQQSTNQADTLDNAGSDVLSGVNDVNTINHDHDDEGESNKFSGHDTHTKLAPKGKDCVIDCENGGLCEFVSDSLRELRHIFQSGGLIQRCRCPPGWGGVACEIPTENCILRTKTCELSGRSCDKVGNQWTCHCNIADQVDNNLAAAVCRRGYTEYCSDYYDPEGPLYYCTNGGKCNSDFLSAEESPGDLATRRKYMDAGCRCNENFYGEHCEKMRFDPVHLTGFVDPKWVANTPYSFEKDGGFEEEEDVDNGISSVKDSDDSTFLDMTHPIALVVIGAAFLVLVCAIAVIVYFCYRQHKRRQRREARRAARRRARESGDEFHDEYSSRQSSRYTDRPGDISLSSSRSGVSSLYSYGRNGTKRGGDKMQTVSEDAPEQVYLSDPHAYYTEEHRHFNDDGDDDHDDDQEEDRGFVMKAVQPPSSTSPSGTRA